MAEERFWRRVVRERQVSSGDAERKAGVVAPRQEVEQAITEHVEARRAAPVAPASAVTNVNVTPQEGESVTVNTPDGTQVNVSK